MDTYILGLLPENEDKQKYNMNNTTIHLEENRKLSLVDKEAFPFFYFEVFRKKDNCYQVHCLLEDSSILIFNKDNNKLVTVIIGDKLLIERYIRKTSLKENDESLMKLYKCAKLNKKYKAKKILKDEILLEEYLCKKRKILEN